MTRLPTTMLLITLLWMIADADDDDVVQLKECPQCIDDDKLSDLSSDACKIKRNPPQPRTDAPLEPDGPKDTPIVTTEVSPTMSDTGLPSASAEGDPLPVTTTVHNQEGPVEPSTVHYHEGLAETTAVHNHDWPVETTIDDTDIKEQITIHPHPNEPVVTQGLNIDATTMRVASTDEPHAHIDETDSKEAITETPLVHEAVTTTLNYDITTPFDALECITEEEIRKYFTTTTQQAQLTSTTTPKRIKPHTGARPNYTNSGMPAEVPATTTRLPESYISTRTYSSVTSLPAILETEPPEVTAGTEESASTASTPVEREVTPTETFSATSEIHGLSEMLTTRGDFETTGVSSIVGSSTEGIKPTTEMTVPTLTRTTHKTTDDVTDSSEHTTTHTHSATTEVPPFTKSSSESSESQVSMLGTMTTGSSSVSSSSSTPSTRSATVQTSVESSLTTDTAVTEATSEYESSSSASRVSTTPTTPTKSTSYAHPTTVEPTSTSREIPISSRTSTKPTLSALFTTARENEPSQPSTSLTVEQSSVSHSTTPTTSSGTTTTTTPSRTSTVTETKEFASTTSATPKRFPESSTASLLLTTPRSEYETTETTPGLSTTRSTTADLTTPRTTRSTAAELTVPEKTTISTTERSTKTQSAHVPLKTTTMPQTQTDPPAPFTTEAKLTEIASSSDVSVTKKPETTTIPWEKTSTESARRTTMVTSTEPTTTTTTSATYTEPPAAVATTAAKQRTTAAQRSTSQTETRRRETTTSSEVINEAVTTAQGPLVTSAETSSQSYATTTMEDTKDTTEPDVKTSTSTTVTSSETTGNSSESTTTKKSGGTPSPRLFTDIPYVPKTTSVPAWCAQPCPDQYLESETHCYGVLPIEKSNTYSKAISYCQGLGTHYTLATTADFGYVTNTTNNFELFRQMLDYTNTKLVYVNMLASTTFRADKKVNVIDFDKNSAFNLDPVKVVGTSDKSDTILSICRTTKYCGPNTCTNHAFEDVDPYKLEFAYSEDDELQEGETEQVYCQNALKWFNLTCTSVGELYPHPSFLTCQDDETYNPDREEETELNPVAQTNCSKCYRDGTKSCKYSQEWGGYICNCKPGWTKFTCWKSPDLCEDVECGMGKCVSQVDHPECDCAPGVRGDTCAHNISRRSLFGTDDSVSMFDAKSMAAAAAASTSIVTLIAKFLSKIVIVGECEDPQDTYQDYRHALLSMGNLAAMLFTYPSFFNIDALGCRFYFWVVNCCYTMGLGFWCNESINIYTTIRAVHRNTWTIDHDGVPRIYLKFLWRVVVPMLATCASILLICASSWEEVPTTWTCFGSFSLEATAVWTPIVAINVALLMLSFSFAEGSLLLIKNRPHYEVRQHNWFAIHAPAKESQVLKVRRNLPFVFVGPFLHVATWLALALASDTYNNLVSAAALIFNGLYCVLNTMQNMFTVPGWYTYASALLMLILPEKWSPTYDPESMRDRPELLAKVSKKLYAREMTRTRAEAEEKLKAELAEIENKNSELLKKFPNLPPTLLFHVPEEGPTSCYPEYPFEPTLEHYITKREREILKKRWTRSYLLMRAHYKESPKECTDRVLRNEMKLGLLNQEQSLIAQEAFIWKEWEREVPDLDHIKLTPNADQVTLLDNNKDPMVSFERAVSKLVAVVDRNERRKRYEKLMDRETAPFVSALAFLNYEPAKELPSVTFESVDSFGYPHEETFIKVPDVLLPKQVEQWDKDYEEGMRVLNEKFDKMYDDDIVLQNWKDTPHEEAAKEVLKVVPATASESETRTRNPRKYPIDSLFLDESRAGFIGPQSKPRVPLGPYEDWARKSSFYQEIVDSEFKMIQRNAYYQNIVKRIREGDM